MRSIIVYTTENCSHCVGAKALLARRGIEFTEINLARDPVGREELAQRTGRITFPQIEIDGQTVGGFRELLLLDRDGQLDELLAA